MEATYDDLQRAQKKMYETLVEKNQNAIAALKLYIDSIENAKTMNLRWAHDLLKELEL